jgi:hypothetical protein
MIHTGVWMLSLKAACATIGYSPQQFLFKPQRKFKSKKLGFSFLTPDISCEYPNWNSLVPTGH